MVPYADWNLLKFPDKDQAMAKIKDLAFFSDILPTGFHGCVVAGVTTGLMLGTLTPIVLFPHEVFIRIPYAPTLEGQYIIKNLVLISAGIVVGATVRGGGMVAEPYRVDGLESGRQPPKEFRSSGEGHAAEGGSGS